MAPRTNRRSPDVDQYIKQAAPFARPILTRLRGLFHQACPQMQESMKWSFPHFEYKGIVGSMVALKREVGFGFWKASLMKDPHGLFKRVGKTSMGAAKVTRLDELPSDDVLLAYIAEAVSLNEAGKTVTRPKKKAAAKEPEVPPDLSAALQKHKKALATFTAFSPSHRKEYVEWITEAKQQATRDKRLATAVEWLSEGKPRHWKYIKK